MSGVGSECGERNESGKVEVGVEWKGLLWVLVKLSVIMELAWKVFELLLD